MDRRDAIKLLAIGASSLLVPPKGSWGHDLRHALETDNNATLITDFVKNTNATTTVGVQHRLSANGLSRITNNSIVRSIIFRSYSDQGNYSFVSALQAQYGDTAEWFLYKLVVEKITQEFAKSRWTNANGEIVVPTKQLFVDLASRFTRNDLITFAKSCGLDTEHTKKKLSSKNDYNWTAGTQLIKKYGHEFVPYNMVHQKLLGLGLVDISSSYKGATEDGSSMHYLRTGLEIKKKTHDVFCSFLIKFKAFASQYGGARVVVRGAREFGHAYDRYFDHSKEHFGRPLSNMPQKATYDSHELGNCIDLRASGPDGIVLYEYFRKHTKGQLIRQGTRQMFVDGDCSFAFMYHGGDPMGGHVHTWMGS
ncbi:MAG: hypothetical protein WC004_03210 [Candidatus Absconditabacterales bacterium]